MSLPGPILPPTPPTEPREGEWYTPRYFGRVTPGVVTQGGFRDRSVLAVIVIVLVAIVLVLVFLSRL